MHSVHTLLYLEIHQPCVSHLLHQAINSKVLFRMNNSQKVDTTGNKIHRDGYDWYEIYLDNDQYGWIAGHFIGY